MGAPPQAGDLAASVNGVDASAGCGVPEVNVTIVATASSGQEIVLPWAPGESLDSGVVVGLLELGSGETAGIPDGDKVVIAAGSQLTPVGAPLETADFSSVGLEVGDLVVGDADIVVEEPSVTSTC